MNWASIGSLAIFLLFAAVGLALFFVTHPAILGIVVFLIAGLIGSVVADRVFGRFATPEEKQREIEDRVRNSDL